MENFETINAPQAESTGWEEVAELQFDPQSTTEGAVDMDDLHPEVRRFVLEHGKMERKFTLAEVESLDFPELETLLEREVEIAGNWNPVEIVTPSNLSAEKNKFLSSFAAGEWPSAPRFEYALADSLDYTAQKDKLAELRRAAKGLAKQYRRSEEAEGQLKYYGSLLAMLKVTDDLMTTEVVDGIKTRDDRRTRRALDRKYGTLSPALEVAADRAYIELLNPSDNTEVAEPILTPDQQKWLKRQKYNADQTADVMRWALAEYGLLAERPGDPGFMVVVEGDTTAVDVRDKNQTGHPMVLVPRGIDDSPKTGKNVLGLIGHEIESHVRQSMNGEMAFRFGGTALKIDGEGLYEGLAKQADLRFSREYFGEDGGKPLPYYVKSIRMAQDGATFTEVFMENYRLRRAVSENSDPYDQKLLNNCWATTYRVFRGSTDPENRAHYAMPKDKAYLEGYLMAEELERMGYGSYNQAAITTGAGLRLLGMFDIEEEQLPYPYRDLQRKYWEEVLLPKYQQETGNI